MKKAIVVLLAASILLAAFSGCLQPEYGETPLTGEEMLEEIPDTETDIIASDILSTDISDCSDMGEGEDPDFCYLGVARSDSDSDVCANIESEFVRNICYEDVAISSLNTAVCDNITDSAQREECKEIVLDFQQD